MGLLLWVGRKELDSLVYLNCGLRPNLPNFYVHLGVAEMAYIGYFKIFVNNNELNKFSYQLVYKLYTTYLMWQIRFIN